MKHAKPKRANKHRTAQAHAGGARKSSKKLPAKNSPPTASRDKVRAHRMRKRGLRLVQMWLPDTRTRDFAEQAHKDSLAIASSEHAAQDQAWVDAVSWWNSPEARAFEELEPSEPWWRVDRDDE